MSAQRKPGLIPGVWAVHGKKRAGKGTVAEYLVQEHGFVHVKFADPLKAMLTALLLHFGLGPDVVARCIESDLKEVPLPCLGGKSARYAMQTIGTEWRDLIDRHLWINMALRRIDAHRSQGRCVALDDLRFPYERERLQGIQAHLWMVTTERVLYDDVMPRDLDELLYGAASCFNFDAPARAVMTKALLRYCGMSTVEIEAAITSREGLDQSVDALAGWTPRMVLASLDGPWRQMMAKPWVANPQTTAAHVSEQSMPEEWFEHVFRNDGTIRDLYAQVEAALIEQSHARAA